MAFDFQTHDAPDIAPLVRQDDQSRSAKDRRRFAAVEALPLGHGGTPDMAHLLGCAPHPIQAGLRELPPLPDDPAGPRVRQPGGGRQKTAATHPAWLQHGQATSKERIAGDPRRDDGLGTDGTPQAMPDRRHAHGVCAGPRLVRRLRETLGVARRQSATVLPGGDSPPRAAPCRPLGHLMQEFLAAGHPVLRLATKQQACVGPLSRPGTVSCPQALQACEPACPRRARGVLMPPGIDALAQQHGGMPGGRSRETTAGACESLRWLWDSDGRRLDPNASALLLVGAGGGRNRCHTPRCQAALPAVVNDLAGPIRVAPSPASGSKGKPIERRLFRHVTRAWQGVLCDA